MSGLAMRGVSLRYPGAAGAAVAEVSFEVPGGSLTALIGPSGCGKTTVLHLAAGLLAPGEGDVVIGGRTVTALPAEMRPVGMVFQSNALFPHLTATQNIEFALQASGHAADAARARAVAALQNAGLSAIAGARPAELSGGQQQRVALARALVLAPSVLLLDEPLSSVDAVLRRSLLDELRALQRQRDLTVVYVTHDHLEALALSDQIVLLNAGRVEQAGSPRALYERPATAFVASFMGEAGIFPGVRRGGGAVWVGPLQLPELFEGAPGAVRVAVRPEAWRLGPATASGLAGSVVKRCYLGKAVEYVVKTGLGLVLVTSRGPLMLLELGAPVSLHLGAHGASVLEA
ncbi:MAG: ABC transporter ATP-binding protein [Burkholderiales bacterium]|nr:ABC transporter ATP-binding protein [Burkholderiales bacterium]